MNIANGREKIESSPDTHKHEIFDIVHRQRRCEIY